MEEGQESGRVEREEPL